MKKWFLTPMIAVLITVTSCSAASSREETKEIQQVIKAYSKAGDDNNSELLASHLDVNYRVIMNRLFGSDSVSIIPKEVYLSKIKSKEWGGDTRELSISNIDINGNTASARVLFSGQKMTFESILLMTLGKDGQWRIVCDMPVMR